MWHKRRNRASGQMVVELPFVIMILLLVVAFPLLDLATICLRATTVFAAARNAAHYASREQSFTSARATAIKMALATNERALRGVRIAPEDVVVTILGTPLKAGLPPINQTTPLDEAKSKEYLYQLDVQVTGKVEPLLKLNSYLFGHVGGLTEDFPVKTSFRAMYERPNTLVK